MASGPNSSGTDLVVSRLRAAMSKTKFFRNEASNNPFDLFRKDFHIRTCGKLPKETRPWITEKSLRLAKLRSQLHDYRQQGYRLTNLVGYNDIGRERYLTLWINDQSIEWSAIPAMSKDEYFTAVEDFKAKGYQLTKVCGYVGNNKIKFAAVWEKRKGPLVVTKVNMTTESFIQDFQNYSKLNCRLVHVNAYAVNNEVRLAGIWEQSSASFSAAPYYCSTMELHKEFEKYLNKGYIITSVYGYCLPGKEHYGALFEKRADSCATSAKWGISYDQYLHEFHNIIAKGFTPTYVHAFPSGLSVKYCIAWNKD